MAIISILNNHLTHSKRWPLSQRWSATSCPAVSTSEHHHNVGACSPSERFPMENEAANVGANEDADDNVAIVVHGESARLSAKSFLWAQTARAGKNTQHHKVGNGKLQHMQQCSNGLLMYLWAITGGSDSTRRWTRAALVVHGLG